MAISAIFRNWCRVLCAVVAVCTGWAFDSAMAAGPIQLRDVTADTGIDFEHTDGSSGRKYIVETVSAGLALFDYDGDGDVDVYFLNGAPLPGRNADANGPPRNKLYRNELVALVFLAPCNDGICAHMIPLWKLFVFVDEFHRQTEAEFLSEMLSHRLPSIRGKLHLPRSLWIMDIEGQHLLDIRKFKYSFHFSVQFAKTTVMRPLFPP